MTLGILIVLIRQVHDAQDKLYGQPDPIEKWNEGDNHDSGNESRPHHHREWHTVARNPI